MVGEKLRGLTQYLLDHNVSAPKKFDSWMEQGRLMVGGEDLGNGYRLGFYRYQAIFTIEDYSKGADLLMALVLIWLMENEPDRPDELGEPEIVVDEVNDRCEKADIEISITFEEPIEVVRDTKGDLTYRGSNYRVDTVLINQADEVSVGDQTIDPTDWRETDASYREPV